MEEQSMILEMTKRALYEAHDVLEKLGVGGAQEVDDDRVTDISTKGDRAVSRRLIDFFREQIFLLCY